MFFASFIKIYKVSYINFKKYSFLNLFITKRNKVIKVSWFWGWFNKNRNFILQEALDHIFAAIKTLKSRFPWKKVHTKLLSYHHTVFWKNYSTEFFLRYIFRWLLLRPARCTPPHHTQLFSAHSWKRVCLSLQIKTRSKKRSLVQQRRRIIQFSCIGIATLRQNHSTTIRKEL